MKAIHDPQNWRYCREKDSLWYRFAPEEGEGFAPAQTINREVIVRTLRHRNKKRWRASMKEPATLLPFIWEVCARWENGEFDVDSDSPKERGVAEDMKPLVCAVHRHLGSAYDDFVRA